MKKIVIGIPIYNEEELLLELYKRIKNTIDKNLIEKYDVDILFVNDGSTDKTTEILKEIAEKDKKVKVINFSRNFGLEAALSAIIENSYGDALVIIDGDLQDPPELIPELIKKWEEGYDVVYTIKRSRKEFFIKKWLIGLFYKIQHAIADITIPIQSGNFSLLDKKVVDIMKRFKEKNKYFPGLRAWVGFNQYGLYYDRDKRYAGKPKMNFKKLFNLAMDGIFSYTKLPQRLAYIIGTFFIIIGILLFIYVLYGKLVKGSPIGWASLILTIYIVGGFQLFIIGLLGEYIIRIFDESRNRPDYIIKDKINI